MYEAPAKMLINEGFCHVPVDAERVAEANENFAALFRFYIPETGLCGTRLGEISTDVGLIQKTKAEGGDDKWYFHVANDMYSWLPKTAQQAFEVNSHTLKNLSQFKLYLQGIIAEFSTALQQELGIMSSCFRTAIDHCGINSVPYSVNTLRGLFYENGPEQTGAKEHSDRAFLSGHCGDLGGELQAHIENSGWQRISPEIGHMLIFPGAKALWMTAGQIKPLKHRSVTVPGEDRRALVAFMQADVGYTGDTAEKYISTFNQRYPHL